MQQYVLHVLLVVAAGLYIALYVRLMPKPTSPFPLGWWGWWDQSQYLKSAAALARFYFGADAHWYSWGYPLLGSLFYGWMPQHPFVFVDLASLLISCWALFQIAARLVSRVEAALIVLLGFLLQLPIMTVFAEPWNSSPCHAMIYVAVYCLFFRGASSRVYFYAAVAAGVAFLCRPVALIAFLPLFVGRLIREPNMRTATRRVGVVAAGLAPFLVGFFVANYLVFGSFETPYMRNESSTVGFSLSPIWYKAYALFAGGSTVYTGETRSLVSMFPWLVLIGPGWVELFRRCRLTTAVVTTSCLMILLLYCAYNNFSLASIFKYHAIHYMAWIFPLAFLPVYMTVRSSWRTLNLWQYAGLLVLPSLIVAFFHLQVKVNPVPVSVSLDRVEAPGVRHPERCRIVAPSVTEFDALVLRGWPEDGRAVPSIVADGRKLSFISDYGVLPNALETKVLFTSTVRATDLEIGVADAYPGPWSLQYVSLANILPSVYPSLEPFRKMTIISRMD